MNDQQERQIKRMLREVESLGEQPMHSGSGPRPREKRPREVACNSFYHHALRQDPNLDQRLQEELREKRGNKQYQKMQTFRERLPSFAMKDELLSLIRSNQVIVISGETGCGKTTQVPQFILDDYISRGQGSTCRVVCTQPRRISAITVAERVAAERAEKCGSDMSVGYQIRLENSFPRPQGCMLYCTTGILLKWLEGDKLLRSVSHVVLDEVHERDILSDFLLIILKDLLPQRPDLKLILMSATLRAELFSDFFCQAPMVNIPGFTFPVTEYYLEDILQSTGYQPPEPRSSREPAWVKYKRGRRNVEEDKEKKDEYQRKLDEYIKAMRGTYRDDVVDILSHMDHDNLDVELAVELLKYICLQKPEGAILVFMPGWDTISKLNDALTSQRMFASDKFIIIPLHSMMPTINQKQVFDHPPPGVRKIIIATNIAETSITIDDVVYVVNMGRVKESNFDVEKNLKTIKAEWISKASAHQRRGRSGRVQDGECYHVYSQLKASLLQEFQVPEIQRTPLEELCLSIKTLKLGKVVPFIEKAMEPPDMKAVSLAISSLIQMSAFDDNEELTALGYHLSRLPCEPRVGKMMLFGAMFCCLDPILTIAASLAWKDPFFIPLGKEKIADERRRELSNNTRSDHLMLCNAMSGWEDAKDHHEEGSYCWRNFMSANILKMLSKMKGQFCDVLHELRFVSHSYPKHSAANRNSENEQLVKAVLCAGLYPKVAYIAKLPRRKRATGGLVPAKLRTPEDGRVEIHPKSINSKEAEFRSRWLLYHQKIKSTSIFLHDTSMVEPYPLLFCGGKISWKEEEGHETVYVDDDIKFHCSQETADLVIKLRKELDRVMEQKITNPGPTDWSQDSHEGKVMRAIVDILVMESDNRYDDDHDDQGFVHSHVQDEDEYDDDDRDERFHTREQTDRQCNNERDRGCNNDRNRGFVRPRAQQDKRCNNVQAQNDWWGNDGEDDVGNDDGRSRRYWQASSSGKRDFDDDDGRQGSSYGRSDSHGAQSRGTPHRGNQHQRHWNQR